MVSVVLSVTILETTKTMILAVAAPTLFYRSQFWRLQKRFKLDGDRAKGFIGHNFGDYKNSSVICHKLFRVLSVTILETTKTQFNLFERRTAFYRSQFWRLQKPTFSILSPLGGFIGHNFGDYKNLNSARVSTSSCFIGHNFGDYKNLIFVFHATHPVLSVTILETTKTQMVSANYTIKVRSYSA